MPTVPIESLLNPDEPTTVRDVERLLSTTTLAALTDLSTLRAVVLGWAESVSKRILDTHPPPATLGDSPALHDVEMRAIEALREELLARAQDADVAGTRELETTRDRAKVAARTRAQPARATSMWSRAVDQIYGASEPATPDLSPPEDVRQSLRQAALALLGSELALRYARRLDEIARQGCEVAARREKRHRALRDALTNIQRNVRARLATFPVRDGVLPADAVLDDAGVAAALVKRSFDPAAFLQLVREGPESGSVEEALLIALAGEVKRLAQRPRAELVPDLVGRSVRDRFDTLVRDGAPWAPLDRAELPNRAAYDGVTIGVVEADDDWLRGQLKEALRRVGDVALLDVDGTTTRLPAGVIGRTVRQLGLLPTETAAGMLFDYMAEAGDPAGIGLGASRDWVGDLVPLVSQERLVEEIARRRRRSEDTTRLEIWLARPTVEVAEDDEETPREDPTSVAAK